MIFIYERIGEVIGFAITCYLVLVLAFRKTLISVTDPFNLQLLLLSGYLAGTLVLGLHYAANSTYVYTLLLIATYLLSGTVIENYKREKTLSYPSISVTRDVQRFFVYGITGSQGLNLLVNYAFGFIPLLHGTESRALTNTSGITSLQVFQPVLITLSLYMTLFTSWPEIKIVSAFGVFLGIAVTILSGSKSALFVFVGCFLTYDYLLNWKVRAGLFSVRGARLIRQTRIRAAVALLVTVMALPAYLVAIGAGQNMASSVIGIVVRLFGGFDGLAALVQGGVDFHDAPKLNLAKLYFYPFYAKFGTPPDFKAVGSYILYLTTGDYYTATTSLYPNSTLPLELLFSFESLVLVFAFAAGAAACIFYIRRFVLTRPRWRMIHLFLFAFVATSPISMLIDGAYFVNLLYFELMFYLLINSVLNLVTIARTGRLVYVFF